jgi:hypothetical protein
MMRVGALAVAWVVSLTCGFAAAEIPPLPKERLMEEADLVVSGTVTRVKTQRLPPTKERLRESRHALSVEVSKVEKGRLAGGKKVLTAVGSSYVLPPGYAGTAGIRSDTYDYIDDVRKGWVLTLYLKAAKNGAYEFVIPNGFSVLRKPGKKGRRAHCPLHHCALS